MGALLQYGYLLYIANANTTGQQDLGKGDKRVCDVSGKKSAPCDRRETINRMREIDRRCFFVFPAAGLGLSLMYWTIHLVKYSQD